MLPFYPRASVSKGKIDKGLFSSGSKISYQEDVVEEGLLPAQNGMTEQT